MSKAFKTHYTLINAPQWFHNICVGSLWFCKFEKKLSGKADLDVCGHFVTLYGYYLSMVIELEIWPLPLHPHASPYMWHLVSCWSCSRASKKPVNPTSSYISFYIPLCAWEDQRD